MSYPKGVSRRQKTIRDRVEQLRAIHPNYRAMDISTALGYQLDRVREIMRQQDELAKFAGEDLELVPVPE